MAKKESTEIILPETCGIENVVQYKDIFMKAAGQKKDIHIQLSKVSEMDLSFFQILFSFFKDVKSSGNIAIDFQGQVSDNVRKNLFYAGLVNEDTLVSANDMTEIFNL